jgi:hypothetical protein
MVCFIVRIAGGGTPKIRRNKGKRKSRINHAHGIRMSATLLGAMSGAIHAATISKKKPGKKNYPITAQNGHNARNNTKRK